MINGHRQVIVGTSGKDLTVRVFGSSVELVLGEIPENGFAENKISLTVENVNRLRSILREAIVLGLAENLMERAEDMPRWAKELVQETLSKSEDYFE
jgi:hypothetical protein